MTESFASYMETKADAEILKYATGRQMFGPNGEILDWRTSVLLEITGDDGSRSAKAYPASVVEDQIDLLRELVDRGNVIEVTDGRRFTKAGKLRAAFESARWTVEGTATTEEEK